MTGGGIENVSLAVYSGWNNPGSGSTIESEYAN